MAFKPIVIEKKIDGVLYKAQFNGMSAALAFQNETKDDSVKSVEYLFSHVIVEPRIDDMDEYFGTDMAHMSEVITFASKVLSGDSEYFPKKFGEKAKTATKE